MGVSELPELRRKLALLEHPGLKKAEPRSIEDLRKEHAAHIFSDGVECANDSQKGVARYVKLDDRTLRDYRTGARAVHFFRVLMLPKASILAIIRALIEFVETLDDEPPASLTGTDNR